MLEMMVLNSHQVQIYICLIITLFKSLTASSYDIFNDVYYAGNGGILENEYYASIPKIRRRYSRTEQKTYFTGNYNGSFYTTYENEHSNSVETSSQLSWETTSARSGRRVATFVNINNRNFHDSRVQQNHKKRNRNTTEHNRSKRTRRNVYGRDDRAFIPINGKFGLTEPYIYTVKISTGCTGIIISPRHVLTAAHCIHDQKDYIAETKDMKVGFLQSSDQVEWIPVKSMKVSKGWIEGGKEEGPYYDYALLRLTRKHKRPYIRLSVSEAEHHGVGERIYFTSFDDDKPDNTMWYRCVLFLFVYIFIYFYLLLTENSWKIAFLFFSSILV